ncbi:MAG: protein rep [Bacteroidales bacterium]|nr:protein rep [Bacteroidales bacterium]
MIDFERVPSVKKSFRQSSLDTLGQLGTTKKMKIPLELIGRGTDASDNQTLRRKAKKKLVTNKVVLPLIDYARSKGNEDMVRSLWNTYHCQERLILSENIMHGVYCKNRICTVCNGNRKAEMINKYLPIVETWSDPHFITLTAKSCFANQLYDRMRNTKRAFKIIADIIKKRHQRGKGPKLVAIKSLECNFNPYKRTYNPHFHILVPSIEVAEIVLQEWLRTWTGKYAQLIAQKIRKVEDRERDLIEVVKYGSKILTEPNPNNKIERRKITRRVYIAALYNILRAMRGLRLTDTYGFELPKSKTKTKSVTVFDYDELSYDMEMMDWVNEDTGETLSNYEPDPELLHILNKNIETELC